MEILELFGQRIRALRGTEHSREQIAEAASITPNYLGEIERGEKWPSLEVMVSLSSALGVEISALFEFSFLTAKQQRKNLHELLDGCSDEQIQTHFRALRLLLGR